MSIFVRRREAADLLGVSARPLARWHESGVLRAIKIGPRLVGYDVDDLRRFTRHAPEESAPEGAGIYSPLDAAKDRLTIPELWAWLGLPGEPRRHGRSPFREERAATRRTS